MLPRPRGNKHFHKKNTRGEGMFGVSLLGRLALTLTTLEAWVPCGVCLLLDHCCAVNILACQVTF